MPSYIKRVRAPLLCTRGCLSTFVRLIISGLSIHLRFVIVARLVLFLTIAGGLVQGASDPVDLPVDLSLEELINIKVTSVSKKEQNLNDAASAIFVLSNDALRRSGATSVAEALRLVPGMEVGAVNSSRWAISARGFNSVYANKLLVLVDGRVVYTPLFGGVYWDFQQTALEDIDRIEVIRGPGGTLWGANAVNGVINVVTRSAKETQGGYIFGSGGDALRAAGGFRWGDQVGKSTYYRVFGSYQSRDNYPLANGQSAHDGWDGWTGGFRLDHYLPNDGQFTWQGDGTGVNLDEGDSDAYTITTLARWSRRLSPRSAVEAQAYVDRSYRNEVTRGRTTTDTLDLAWQQTFGWGERNNLIWGFGYRAIFNQIEQTTPLIIVRETDFTLHLVSAFLQDELELVPAKVLLTAGTKIEHNDFTGFEFQPSVRIAIKPALNQTIWAAISRAVATSPEIVGRDIASIAVAPPLVGPDGALYIPSVVGNPDLASDTLIAYELGYRIQPTRRVGVDLAGFYNRYSKINSFERDITRYLPGTPFGVAEIPFQNLAAADNYGGEAALSFSPSVRSHGSLAYSVVLTKVRAPAAASRLFVQAPPRQQLSLRASHDFSSRVNLDAQIRYVAHLEAVPDYIAGDLRFLYKFNDQVEFALVGQNLLDNRHPEQSSTLFAVTAEVPRSFHAKLIWRF